jgi:hypothetical protein
MEMTSGAGFSFAAEPPKTAITINVFSQQLDIVNFLKLARKLIG